MNLIEALGRPKQQAGTNLKQLSKGFELRSPGGWQGKAKCNLPSNVPRALRGAAGERSAGSPPPKPILHLHCCPAGISGAFILS